MVYGTYGMYGITHASFAGNSRLEPRYSWRILGNMLYGVQQIAEDRAQKIVSVRMIRAVKILFTVLWVQLRMHRGYYSEITVMHGCTHACMHAWVHALSWIMYISNGSSRLHLDCPCMDALKVELLPLESRALEGVGVGWWTAPCPHPPHLSCMAWLAKAAWCWKRQKYIRGAPLFSSAMGGTILIDNDLWCRQMI